LGNLLSDKKIEVKTDFQLAETNNIAVEYASRGKYSGISPTEEVYWHTTEIFLFVVTITINIEA